MLLDYFSTFSLQGDSAADGGATNHLCATVSHIPVKQEKSFFCKPIVSGRFVYIQVVGHPKYVIICEVEVYSTYTHSKFFLRLFDDLKCTCI